MKTLILVFAAALSFVNFAIASYPQPVGLWEFDNAANLPLAATGQDLSLVGYHAAVAGIDGSDGAVLDQPTSYYSCTHSIALGNGHGYVNDWSVMMDIKVPVASFGSWVSFFQTDFGNNNDGDCFVAPDGSIGVSQTGYSSNSIVVETWYRIIISVSNSNFYRIYVDGMLWLQGTPQAIDGRFSLDPQLLLFADNNNEDAAIHCSNVAIWDHGISAQHARYLGSADPAMVTTSIAGQNLLDNFFAEYDLSSWTIADGYDWQATNITGWHFPHTGNHYFTPGRVPLAEINQTIDLEFIADDIDNGYVIAIIEGCVGGYDSDQARIVVEYLDANAAIISIADSGWVVGVNSPNWTHLQLPDTDGLTIPSGTRSVKYRLLAKRIDGDDCQAFFDDLVFEYRLAPPGSNNPAVPSVSTSSSGATGVDVQFVLYAAFADTTEISYQIDWGSESDIWSDLQPADSDFIVQHTWPLPGTYNVRTRSRDSNDRISQWSQPLTITISGNVAGVFKSETFLQNVTQDSITIVWETDRIVKPVVEWGATTSYGNQIAGLCIDTGSGVYICKVRIPALDTNTIYHYRAYSGSTISGDGTFKTAPQVDSSFNFAVWGDSQRETTNPAISNAMFTDMAADVDFGVTVGDIVQYESYGYYTNPFRKYLCNILANKKPVFVAFGNHDEPANSFVRNTMQNSGMKSFSFNYGNSHFTCIDYSDCVKGTLPSDGHINSLPLEWIEQDLASDLAKNATWRFFFIHVPPYCERWFDGSSLMQTHLVPLLNKYNVHICFSGHTHEYQRGLLNGTFYVITGCGSYLDVPEVITEDWPFMTVGGAQDIPSLPNGGGLINGWTEVQINGTELNLMMHGYNSDGTCHGVIDTVNYAQSDFTMDGKVDVADFSELASAWLNSEPNSIYDIAGRENEIIDFEDLAEFALYWRFQGQF